MVLGATILLATFASAIPHAPYSRMPVCDENSVDADEAAEAAPPQLPAEEPLTPSLNCSEPPPLPPVVDCNDQGSQVWVQQMVGSCDMPRSSSPSLQRAPRERPPACNGWGCDRDPLPLHAVEHHRQTHRSVVDPTLRELFDPDLQPLAARAAPAPRSIFPPRLERPPRA